ncbi:hypothetical protein BA893_24260 [Vibrio natriegens]|nr:hypothetical protein BA893_24260 [Vibrio natriegens]
MRCILTPLIRWPNSPYHYKFAVAGIDEYRSLAKKLPTFESELLAKSELARERSVQYTVKLEALIYAIELNQNGAAKC